MVSCELLEEQKDYLHYVFVYCREHDQGAVSIFNNDEWFNISLTSSVSCYKEGVFKNILMMCGCNNATYCKSLWDICGYLEFNQLTKQLLKINSVKTNFDREGGRWKFKYFQDEIYNSQGRIEKNKIPLPVRVFLSHFDSLNTND